MTGKKEREPHLPLKSRIMSYNAFGRDNADDDDLLFFCYRIAVEFKSTPKTYSIPDNA